jgi:hypothetical protein
MPRLNTETSNSLVDFLSSVRRAALVLVSPPRNFAEVIADDAQLRVGLVVGRKNLYGFFKFRNGSRGFVFVFEEPAAFFISCAGCY